MTERIVTAGGYHLHARGANNTWKQNATLVNAIACQSCGYLELYTDVQADAFEDEQT